MKNLKEKDLKKKEYKTKVIELNGNRKLINRCRKEGLELFNPQGEFNGFGYTKKPLCVRVGSIGTMRKFNKIKKELDMLPPKKVKTEEEKQEAWCRRLAKLTGYSIEECSDIANEKLKYKNDQIDNLRHRQATSRYSVKRETLINKIERENPLRYIRDEEHAMAIVAAHARHNHSNYDTMLEYAHDLEEYGVIERGTAREYAREHFEFDKKR